MTTYLNEAGQPYQGDRQIREDGSWDSVIPDRPSVEYVWNGQAWELQRIPNVSGLATEFQYPGNVLYGSVVQKVSVAGFVAQDHWQNFKLLLMSNPPEEAISAGIQYLANLLATANQPLTESDKAAWNALVQKYDLDQGCQLR
jgi:hypothetical protein